MRTKFQLLIHKANGQQFEDLFVDIMSMRYAGFRPVKAFGRQGDKKNDGWIENLGSYFQVSAPENLFSAENRVIDKIYTDFEQLKLYWDKISSIRKFTFVVNDKYNGVPPSLNNVLHELRKKNPQVEFSLFCAQDLENEFRLLNPDQIESIIGWSPANGDNEKVRSFLTKLSPALNELFNRGREAGYFFPNISYDIIHDVFEDDWKYSALLANDPTLQATQIEIRDVLVGMINIIDQDAYYDRLGESYKYKIPFDIEDRNALIEQRKDLFGNEIKKLSERYYALRDKIV